MDEDPSVVALLTAHIAELRRAAEEEVKRLDETLEEERREKQAVLDEARSRPRARARARARRRRRLSR